MDTTHTTHTPFAHPLYVMAKTAGPQCNMACTYCYYIEKSRMYGHKAQPGGLNMTYGTLERFVRQYIESQTMPEVLFTWHGGEPLLRQPEFYRRAVELQRLYAGGRHIDNCIQTNGTLITDEWCRFFKDNGWLVGVSVDGPEDMHNAYRRSRGGQPSFARVMHGIELLERHGVEWNAMAVVNSLNANRPAHFYRFFKSIGCRYLQFSPVVERILRHPNAHILAAPHASAEAEVAPFSVRPEQWGRFLCALFDEWVKADVGSTFVQLFDATLANWAGVQPGVCTLAATCGHAGVMEHNGDVFACDHFVFPEYRLGNIHTHTLTEMMYGRQAQAFGRAKLAGLPQQCRECLYLFACHGECPKNRFATTPDGRPGLNYLCPGYHRFFSHAAPYMDFMAQELAEGRAPANVMRADFGRQTAGRDTAPRKP